MCWYSFIKLLFNRSEKRGVILRRLPLLFSKPQNGCAEILFIPPERRDTTCSSLSGFWRVVLGGLYQLGQLRNLLFEGQVKRLHFLVGDSAVSTQFLNELIIGICQHRDDQTEDATEVRIIHASGS